MKTVSGDSISTKQISLSKAAKVLSKFVSAENGASQVISVYLHQATTSFNELSQLHKELKLSHSHQKHKRHRTGNTDQDDEKSTQTIVKFSQEPNDSIRYHAGNVIGSEKHKKYKKTQQKVESRDHRDVRIELRKRPGERKLPTRVQNETESSQVRAMKVKATREQRRERHKKEGRTKKKDKEGVWNFSSNKGEVENPEGESAMQDCQFYGNLELP